MDPDRAIACLAIKLSKLQPWINSTRVGTWALAITWTADSIELKMRESASWQQGTFNSAVPGEVNLRDAERGSENTQLQNQRQLTLKWGDTDTNINCEEQEFGTHAASSRNHYQLEGEIWWSQYL